MAENMEKIDLKNDDLAKFDFRIPFVLEKNLMEEWGQIKNSLYRMLWFHVNFPKSRPQVEMHPVALATYTELYKDKENQSIYKYENNHFTVANNSNLAVSADVMNGWWGPVKLFLGLSGRVNSIPELKSNLEEKGLCGKNLTFEELSKLFSKKVSIGDEKEREEAFNAMLNFLNVVYTIGNFSPIPSSGCFGRIDLDNWACKLYRNMIWGWVGLLESLSCLDVQRERYYASHKFEGYIKNGKPTAYWKKEGHKEDDFSKPEKYSEWETYFRKTTELITNRSKALLSGNEDKIKDILISYYRSPSEASSGNT